MKNFLKNCLEAGNVLLHAMLGIGVAMLFLKWERHFFIQLVICWLIPFGVAWFGEKIQESFFKAKPNAYDAVNTSIFGLIVGIVYLFIYGWKFDSDINKYQEPKMWWFYAGWILIGLSITIWTVKQINKKLQ